LIEVFPAVLCHQAKGTEQSKAKIIEVRVSEVRIWTDRHADVVLRTFPGLKYNNNKTMTQVP